ncbi:hypothetical protein VSR82_12120 [Burkholderia sp. JPY481]
MNSLLAARDIVLGNPLLRGWEFPPDPFYFTDLLPEGVLTLFLGLTPRILFIFPAMVWAAVVCSCIWMTGQITPDSRWQQAAVFVCLGLPIVIDDHSMRVLGTAPTHITTILLGAGLFWFAYRQWCAPQLSKAIFFWLALLAFMGSFSDPFIVSAAIGPAIVVCGLHWLAAVKRDKCVWVAASLALGLVIGRLAIAVVAKVHGFAISPQPAAFADFERLSGNFALVTRGLLMIFGADFTGRPLAPSGGMSFREALAATPATMFARVVFLVAAIAGSLLMVRRMFSGRLEQLRNTDFLLMCFAWSSVIAMLAALLSDQMQNLTSYRYLLPTLVYGSIVGAKLLGGSTLGRLLIVAAGILSAGSFWGTLHVARENPTYFGPAIQGLAAWLQENRLTDGYGPYWSASSTTLASGNSVRTRAVIKGADGLIRPYLWLSRHEWYGSPTGKRFILVDTVNPDNYTTADVIAQFGQPSVLKRVNGYDILIYADPDSRLSQLVAK